MEDVITNSELFSKLKSNKFNGNAKLILALEKFSAEDPMYMKYSVVVGR